MFYGNNKELRISTFSLAIKKAKDLSKPIKIYVSKNTFYLVSNKIKIADKTFTRMY